jgi:heparan-alpha-glucosaminide N-acetyltransferase
MNDLQIDVWGFRTPFLFLEWIGMNAMLVFVMAAQGIFAAFVNGWYYETPDKTLVSGPQWFLLIIFFFIYNILAFILCTSSLS